MKLTLQLFAVLMALFYSASAQAAVSPYDALTVTPAEGTVTSLQHFTITFQDMPVSVAYNSIPTLEKGGGATIEGTMYAGDDGKSVIIDFDECITAPGHYFLNLPENSLTVNGMRLLPITLRFDIDGTIEQFYEQITIDPAEGVVESLQNFVISIPEYIGEIDYDSMATLTNNTTGTTYQAEIFGVRYTALVNFPDEVTEPGEYTLTIPAGSIIIYTMDEDVRELNFHYTVGSVTPAIVGDVDGDGKVGIADVSTLIDILLSGNGSNDAADVDGDGKVGIADVSTLIDILLRG